MAEAPADSFREFRCRTLCKALYVILLYLVLHVLEGYFVTPAVQRRTVTLVPILTVLSQILMWTLTGFLGVALATPLAATGLVLVKTLTCMRRVKLLGANEQCVFLAVGEARGHPHLLALLGIEA